ncbi:MAG: AmmeMemoRadiSam system radical SAM enzyme [Candidatus Buchananbacteria bacterium]
MKEALFYQKIDSQIVKCGLCHQFCHIAPSQRGLCGVRENQAGKLIALDYGLIIAANVDPIEKKPLYHFLPKTETFSIATVGCNLKCAHCQNADISQASKEGKFFERSLLPGQPMLPEEVVEQALKFACPSISYTYTEPTIFFEFALDCMKLASQAGLKNIWVSNGYTSLPALEMAKPYLHAVNIDLKFFDNETYIKICGATLQPILDNLIWYKKNNIWLEVTTLIIPTLNDNKKQLEGVAQFIKKELGEDTPWHVSAFYPTYKLTDISPTSKETVLLAQKIGHQAGLKFVYTGNI